MTSETGAIDSRPNSVRTLIEGKPPLTQMAILERVQRMFAGQGGWLYGGPLTEAQVETLTEGIKNA